MTVLVRVGSSNNVRNRVFFFTYSGPHIVYKGWNLNY
jgi:hypothetical protein